MSDNNYYNINVDKTSSHIEIEDISVLKQKTNSQKNVINEYKNWISMLINIINNSSDFEYTQKVQNVSDTYLIIFLLGIR